MKIFALPALIVGFAVSIYAQTITVPNAPAPKDDTVVISTNLIQIDAVVTDKDDKPVSDLTADDFEIYENGEKQQITNFTPIKIQPPAGAAKSEKTKRDAKSDLPDPDYYVPLRADQVRRTVALVVDDLGLSFANVGAVKISLKKFVDTQMQQGDLVAIVRTGGGIGVLQQFTTDKRVLYAAIEKLRYNANSRTGVSSFAPIKPTDKEDFTASMNMFPDPEGGDSTVKGTVEDKAAEAAFNEFREDGFTVGTLGALGYVVRGMSELPGRKAVTLISEGFSMLESNNLINARIQTVLKSLVETANRSGVVIYTIDPRGLTVPGLNAEDVVVGFRQDSLVANAAVLERERKFTESQQALRYLAYETGGFPFLNQNDINKGIKEVLENQGSYYLIGYQPDEETFDPQKRRYNKLKVVVKRPDLKVTYRSGFFGIADREVKSTPKKPLEKIADALNSPFVRNELNTRMNAMYIYDQKQGNSVRTFVHIKGDQLTCEEEPPDGWCKTVFNVVVLIFGDNGAVTESMDRVETVRLRADALKEVREKGLVYSVLVPVKKEGAYQMKMVIQDAKTQKIGSASRFIQIPNSKKRRMQLSGISLSRNRPDGADENVFQSDERRELALRQFAAGSALRFGFAVYGSKAEKSGDLNALTAQYRIFRDGREIFNSGETRIEKPANLDEKNINVKGVFEIGRSLTPGDYVLQVIIKDNTGGKKEVAAQALDFEVTN